MSVVIKVENISKLYNLKEVGVDTIKSDLKRSWASLRGKEDPAFKLAELNDKSLKGTSDFVWALKDISFEVKQGEILGIMGKNGAGKSTLLKILSRVASPSTGQIKMKGRLASLLEVGTGFHPDLSGRDNIYLNGAILGMRKSEIKKNFDEIVDFSGIERYIDTPVKRYSSGMYVRLAFAVSSSLVSEILIVDEVLAVGDAEFQKKCLGKMQNVSEQGRTVLFVSHNVAAVKNLCTQGIFLEHGKIVPVDSLDKAIELYFGENTYDSYQKTYEKNARPGNSDIKINNVKLIDEKGTIPTIINISKDLILQIQFEVLNDGIVPIFSFSMSHSNGELIFGSMSSAEEGYSIKKYSKGFYSTSCTIPGNLLNQGKFFININGYCENYIHHFFIQNPLSFEAHNDGFICSDYKGNWGGYFKPLLKWETNTL
jgi:lipopolysaccharide transport system ATP-binding protein